MTVTAVPSGHFQGGRGLSVDPTTGNDVRSLEDILNEVVTDLNTITGTVTSPFLYKGNIAAAAGFPTALLVQTGWLYTVTADVTDNDGTKTNTGQVFLAGQEIAWNGTNWTVVGDALTNAWQFKGSIANAAAFPPPAATATTGVKDGHVYRVTTGCTDNDPTKTNTAQVFLTGDIIVWRTNAWYIIQKAPSVATPAAVGVAAAGTSGRPSNDDHVHAHGDQLGGTLHADAVAGVSDGFMTGAMATMLAAHDVSIGAIVDDHVYMQVTGLDMKTDEHEHSAALNGAAGKRFLATHLLIKSSLNVGALNADGVINVGTAADGAQLVSGAVLTGIGAVGTARMVPIAAHAVPVAGNATLYVNVETAETGAGTLEIDVTVVGRQI
jgi:hypothetical protein